MHPAWTRTALYVLFSQKASPGERQNRESAGKRESQRRCTHVNTCVIRKGNCPFLKDGSRKNLGLQQSFYPEEIALEPGALNTRIQNILWLKILQSVKSASPLSNRTDALFSFLFLPLSLIAPPRVDFYRPAIRVILRRLRLEAVEWARQSH